MLSRNSFFIVLFLVAAGSFAQPPKLVVPIGHTKEVLSATFSPDGKKIVTVSADGTAKLWEVSSGTLLNDYKSGGDASAEEVTTATFSPGGQYMIIKYYGEELSIWDINSGKKIWDWSGTASSEMVTASAAINHFSPDGRRIAMFMPFFYDSISPANTPVIYDNNTQQPLFYLKGQHAAVTSLFFTDDGKQIITASADSTIKTWNASNGRLIRNFRFKTAALQMMQLSKNKLLLDVDSTVRLFDIVTGKQIYLQENTKKKQSAGLFELNADGKKLIGLSGLTEATDEHPVAEYNTAVVWDAQTGLELFRKAGLAETGISSLFNPEGSKINLISKDSSVKVFDATTGKLVYALGKFKYLVYSDQYNAMGDKIITTLRDHSISLWDPVTGKINPALSTDTSIMNANVNEESGYVIDMNTNKNVYKLSSLKNFYKTRFGNGGSIIADQRDKDVSIWNAANGKLIIKPGTESAMINDVSISDDGKFMAVASVDHTAKIWDLAYGKLVSECKGRSNAVKGAWISKDNSKLLISTDMGKKILDIDNGKLITDTIEINALQKEILPVGRPYDLESPDGTMRIQWGGDIVQVMDMGGSYIDNDMNKALGPNNGRMDHVVNSVTFSPDSRKIIMTLDDNTTRIFNLDRGGFTSTIILFDSTDYINQLKSGYYQSTPNAAKLLHYITNDSKVISFEQLDVKYNRPDKVLIMMDCRDSSLIASYYNAYIKRLDKLGIDTSAFGNSYSVPEADFMNRDDIEPEQKTDKLSVHIKGIDSTYSLDRFNVWINEVPLLGMKGHSIKQEHKNMFDTTITISLSHGENRIETSVTNINGAESYRKPLSVNYTSRQEDTSRVYFIGVGLNHFADSSNDLTWCVQDIRDLTKTLQVKYGDRFIIVDTLYDENATRTNIRSLKKKLFKTTVDDKVIFSFSGHGLLSKDYDYYLSSYTVNFNDPEQGGIPYDEIENMLDSIPARKKILLLDACHSGEVDKEEMKKIQAASSGLAKNNTVINTGSRGVKVINTDSLGGIGLQNSFELMQSVFVNVGKGTGAIIISASGGVQFAQERSELGHGVFTYSVIETLKKFPAIKVSEFKKYIGNRVVELTNGLQQPTTRNEPIDVDWYVW